MFLRYHYINDKGDGASVFTMLPQTRSLFVNGDIERVNFPHTAFSISYKKVAGGFLWLNLPNTGLRIVYRREPFESLDDNSLYFFPITVRGSVCLDHKIDGCVFTSLRLLAGTIIDLWFNTLNISYVPTINELLFTDFYKVNSLASFLKPCNLHLSKKWLNHPMKLQSLLPNQKYLGLHKM